MASRSSPSTGVHESQSTQGVIPDLSDELEAWKREAESLPVGDPGLSGKEIRESLGMGEKACLAMLRDGLKTGRYRKGKRRSLDVTGKVKWVPVYQIIKEEAPCDQS